MDAVVGESGLIVIRTSGGGGNVGVGGNDSVSASPKIGDSGTSSSNGDTADFTGATDVVIVGVGGLEETVEARGVANCMAIGISNPNP